MGQISLRIPDQVAEKVRHMAAEQGTNESEIWRRLIYRGLDQSNPYQTSMQVETLCILRRFAADKDIEIVKVGKQDARNSMSQIEAEVGGGNQ